MLLPCEIQSDNRAEIYAILVAVRHIEDAGKIDFFTDNKPARNTYNNGKHRARLACHADLWSEIFAILERKHIELNVYWMPSHIDRHKEKLEQAPSWMKDWHVAGNKVADELAGAAAELHAVPAEQAKHIIKIYKDLDLTQNRIIAVTKLLPQRKHNITIHDNIKYKPTYTNQIIEKLKSSQHDCVIFGERLYCCGCSSNISIRAEHINDFIQSSCLIRDRTMTYAVGKQHTHHTHKITIYGGVYMCTSCGATASRNSRNSLGHVKSLQAKENITKMHTSLENHRPVFPNGHIQKSTLEKM